MTAGLTLIVVGLALFLVQRVEGIGYAAVFLVVGSGFLAAYFYSRAYGLLIPACILLGLGAASVAENFDWDYGDPTLLGLGFGFVAIFLIALVYERRTQWWPLIPGGVLVVLGLPDTLEIFRSIFDNWPLILVAIGVIIMLGGFLRPRRRKDAGTSEKM